MRRRRPPVKIANLATHQAPFVTLPALGVYLEVEYQTLRKWVKDGYLPAYRFGRMWRVRTEDARVFERDSFHKAS